ncbi:uncharacterized protein PV07_07881 [Cladophialophora immunda]|uniref:4-coumarate-CoA ligase n=1 Tax=Cladophialophora immunda TaxID=569365 RepID=A0A0D1ZJM2_9EURO|nr:uncharacterized protein PV07_07881 [Cladophialophora immunda]KIW28201.1 hypothetical protein PV07_07881 [Cladophialophora immunda]OQV00331.1 AMP-binding enzyme domain-containing protein [Cladophialophora immunda]
MPFVSKIASLPLQKCSILDFLFPPDQPVSDKPLWIDAADTSHWNSPKSALALAKRFGYGLQQLGVQFEDRCLLFTPNHIMVPVSYFGVVGIGAAFSGANPTFTEKELEYQITILQPKIMLVHPSLIPTAKAAAAKAAVPGMRLYVFSDRETGTIDGLPDWRDILGTPEQGERWQWRKLPGEEAVNTIAAINFSSGTTGLPKGVCVSHFNVVSNVMQIKSLYDFEPSEKWAGFLPLYHAYGQCYAILMATINHIPMLIISKFEFVEYLRIIQEHKITRLQTVPPILIMLNKRPETANYDLSSVKEILCGAAPVSRELEANVSKKFNVRITQGWGMTETTCAVSGIPYYEKSRTGSVGVVMPNTEVKIITDDGREASIGEAGELYVRGPQVCLGYWKNPQATLDSFDPVTGWLKSGDVMVMSHDGWMAIVDRKKELIKVQALQVSPAEVEAALIEHPDIADAGVVGITFDDGEWPRAYVALKEESRGKVTEKEVQEWLNARVSKHKRLVGGVAFIPEVPRLPSGKIQRKVMKEWAKRDAMTVFNSRPKL